MYYLYLWEGLREKAREWKREPSIDIYNLMDAYAEVVTDARARAEAAAAAEAARAAAEAARLAAIARQQAEDQAFAQTFNSQVLQLFP